MKRLPFISAACLMLGGPAAQGQDPHIMAPDEGDVVWMSPQSETERGSGDELRIFVDAETHPHATASFAKFTLSAGGALPVHRHDKTEEFAYFISGEGLAVFVDEEGNETAHRVAPGYVWYNPPAQWHALRNPGSTELSLVFATVPNEQKGLLSFFRHIGVTPGSPAGEPISLEELRHLGREHDMILWEDDEPTD